MKLNTSSYANSGRRREREREGETESRACRAAESRLQMCGVAPKVFSKYQQHMSTQLQLYQ